MNLQNESILIFVSWLLCLVPMRLCDASLASSLTASDSMSSSSGQIFRRLNRDRLPNTDNDPYTSDKVINTVLNINDSVSANVLNNFNVSKDDILRRISAFQPAMINNANSSLNPNGNDNTENKDDDGNTTNPIGSNADDAVKRDRYIDALRRVIESAVERNVSRNAPDPNAAIHDMAFYPLCSKNNQTSWLEENTAKLYFSSNIFDKLVPNTYLHRATLRLRQRNSSSPWTSTVGIENRTEHDAQNSCNEYGEIIHVKISIFVKRPTRGGNNRNGSNANNASNRRGADSKLKKLVCHNFTTKRDSTEWVEIDVRQVIKHWEKMYRSSHNHQNRLAVADPMIAIDVEDEFQMPLKAGLFFEQFDCQASPAIPWSFYGENIRTSTRTQTVPNNPRLDIKWSHHHYVHHHYVHRNHRHRNPNHVENVLKDSIQQQQQQPMPADYGYQTSQP